LRVLQIIQKPQLRGAEIFASQLSNHLIKSGDDVKIIALFPGEGKLPFDGELIRLDRPLNKRFYDFSGWRKLAKFIKAFKPDVVQANAGDTLKFAACSKLLFGWKAKLVFRNANKMGDFIDSRVKFLLNNFYVRRIDHTISVSENCRQDFIATFDFDPQRVTTVPIGVEMVKTDKKSPADLQDIFARGPVIINVGSLVKEKNHSALLRIFKEVCSGYEAAQLLIIGNGALRQGLEAEARSLQISDRVHFLGYRPDVLQIMQNSTVLAMPSLIEGLPGVILEAFYSQLPVVANDVGGVGEVIRSFDTGFLINKNDEASFAEAILKLLNDSQLRKSLADAAYSLVTTEFLNIQIASKFTDVYKIVSNSTGKNQ
jgi:L-malate glycosyltransferase